MKYTYIAFSALLFFVISCKKSNNTPDNFQLMIGSTSFTLDSTFAIVDNTNPFAYSISILGKDTKTNTLFVINAQSVPKSSIGGVYSNTASTQTSQYNILSASLMVTSGSLTGNYTTNNQFTFTLTLDNPSDNRLQGTFRGQLKPASNPNPGNQQPTDQMISGQFKIPFKFVP
jgi:hypothetical protein